MFPKMCNTATHAVAIEARNRDIVEISLLPLFKKKNKKKLKGSLLNKSTHKIMTISIWIESTL